MLYSRTNCLLGVQHSRWSKTPTNLASVCSRPRERFQPSSTQKVDVYFLTRVWSNTMCSSFKFKYQSVNTGKKYYVRYSVNVRLPDPLQSECSKRIRHAATFICKEFARKVECYLRWTGGKLRSSVNFASILGLTSYRVSCHLVSMSTFSPFFVSPSFWLVPNITFLSTSMRSFVKRFGDFYEESRIYYNAHGLLHLSWLNFTLNCLLSMVQFN